MASNSYFGYVASHVLGFILRHLPTGRLADTLTWPIYRRLFGWGYQEVVTIAPNIKMRLYGDMPDMVNKTLLFMSTAKTLAWEPVTARLFRGLVKNKSTVVVAGSHIGYYPLVAATTNRESYVYAFEPDPKNYERLVVNVNLNNLNNIKAIPVALGDIAEQKTMYFDAGQSSLVNTHRGKIKEGVVQVETLDQFCQANNVKPDLLLLDAEGYEPNILKGGLEVVSTSKPDIIFELNPKALSSSGSSAKALTDSLISLGYKLAVIKDDYHHRLNNIAEPKIELLPYTEQALGDSTFVNIYATTNHD